jgi:Ca-activated chloride channel family protein
MKQKSFEKLLQQDAPPPNPAARLAARRAALEEFARANASATQPARRRILQALSDALRLSRNEADGRDSMPWYSRRLVIGGAASLCIAMFGATLVWNAYERDPRIAELEPAANRVVVTAQAESGKRAAADDAAADTNVVPAQQLDKNAAAGSSPQAESGVTGDVAAASPAPAIAASDNRAASTPAAAAPGAEQASSAETRQATEAQPTYAAPPPPMPQPEPAIQTITAADSISPEGPKNEQERLARQAESSASSELEEAIVTGRRAASRPKAGHKSTAPAARSGNSIGGWLSRDNSRTRDAEPPLPPGARLEGRDRFEKFAVNSVKQVADEPVSTFSADVDTASYSFVRKQLEQGVLPQKDAVRAEEMINYFDYAWPAADDRGQPFRPTIVVSDSPWGKGRKLIHIGIKGYELPESQRPDANLVMLLDVSGSMSSPDKLPLVQQSMKLLLGSLKPTDTVAIVVYAGAAGQVLAPTPVAEKQKIIAALDSLSPGGSTAGAEGIELAYQLAESSFRKDGLNRILLCTDGDFNVGIDSTHELKGFVERKREKGIFLSVLGFGQGNYRDELAQALAQNGNGVAAYIDSLAEAQKVLVRESGSSLFTIAKDVKLQVEFNPATVAEYRLVGYETRALQREDFNNDAVDAGDVGAGHTVTAIYEITPVGVEARMVDESRYAKRRPVTTSDGTAREYGYLKIRYKLPAENRSKLIEQPIGLGGSRTGADIQRDAEFSTAVAGFAQLLRGGQFTGSLTYDDVIKSALASRGEDPYGHRNEFVQLVRKAQTARGM